MPIYECTCTKCGTERETLQKHTDSPPNCASCALDAGGAVQMVKRVSRSSFRLKGKGWASDGYEG